ncbi:unnamed protein product [Arctogadus glacialis]
MKRPTGSELIWESAMRGHLDRGQDHGGPGAVQTKPWGTHCLEERKRRRRRRRHWFGCQGDGPSPELEPRRPNPLGCEGPAALESGVILDVKIHASSLHLQNLITTPHHGFMEPVSLGLEPRSTEQVETCLVFILTCFLLVTTETWETAPAVAESPEIKLFGKWSTDDVQINDISLQDYIAVKEKYAKYLPHSGGRYAAKRFRKAQCPIVERLTNSMMMHGRNNGKKLMTCRIVKHAFEIIHLLTGENPLQVLVNAIINSGPREDSTRIGRAGTVRRQAVDVSPLRRVNQAIWLLCTGAREAAFRNIKTIAECLADELINAAKGSSNSYAIKKKDELERVAKSNR